jgi:hypothetical protein
MRGWMRRGGDEAIGIQRMTGNRINSPVEGCGEMDIPLRREGKGDV